MKKENLSFQDINWKNHSALGEQGVQGRLTIGQYELSVVGGKGLYCTEETESYYKPNSFRHYVSFEVAVFQDKVEGGQEFTNKFFYGDFDNQDDVLGWKHKSQINQLIQRIEDSLKTVKIDFNDQYNELKEVTEEFKKIEQTIPKENLEVIQEIAESGLKSNEFEKAKFQEFLDSGWTKRNCKIEKQDRETTHSFILEDTKYIISVYSFDFYVKVRYLSYENGWRIETPYLKEKWTSPQCSYSSGWRSTKNGKYTSYQIVGNERQYSAKGLLKKVNEVNQDNEWNYDAYVNQRQAYNKAKDMLKEKYPNADVVRGNTKYDHSYHKIDLVFKSGSKLHFNVSCYGDKLIKLDSVVDEQKLKFDDWQGWADRFDTQK